MTEQYVDPKDLQIGLLPAILLDLIVISAQEYGSI